jgi:hypothetical protein
MGKVSAGTVAAVMVALLVVLIPVSSHAADNTTYNRPWEKFNIQGGVFFAGLNNKVTVGSEGAGVAIDLEQALGLDTQNTVFRLGTLYRIDQKRRHRVDLDYLYFNRKATKTLEREITVDNVVLPVGRRVDTTFNYQILRAAYSYSFFQDDRMDLAGSFGLFVMPIKFAMSAEGLRSNEGTFKFTAPLPAFGLRGDFAITPKWFLRTNIDFFYLEYQTFKGALVDTRVAVEYNAWEHFGLGLGFDNFRMGLKAENNDYPAVNFQGDIKSSFMGVQLYARYFF